jgi:hypothetical protein
MLTVLAILAVAAPAIATRTFTIHNNCPFTIWPAVCRFVFRS